ncbi:ejaculatory bulb-specific protein 3-like precursor [Plutella xylostella]|uniref:Chemosensory protein 3 n=2 Tax=Plutella xylostella TaxID=51655 RepID=A2TIK4_PLUXY|nr:ejaculatory bulb-specific protein 3-like precursor [Plutella xylostella]ABM92663.1 chemosensory protein CSP3 [Plutella xylostella]ACR43876.1 chemosensory protein 3 [Plutella xylostella]
MNSLVLVCLALVAVAAARPQATYTSKYDGVNVDEILANDRLMMPYIKCALDHGRCSPEAKELKSHIKEALENNCAKCTDKQKPAVRKVIAHLINHKPAEWRQLSDKYDPAGKYTAQYEDQLRAVKA